MVRLSTYEIVYLHVVIWCPLQIGNTAYREINSKQLAITITRIVYYYHSTI